MDSFITMSQTTCSNCTDLISRLEKIEANLRILRNDMDLLEKQIQCKPQPKPKKLVKKPAIGVSLFKRFKNAIVHHQE